MGFEKILNRKNEIDGAVEPPAPQKAAEPDKKEVSPAPGGPKGKKWDSYRQEWVPEGEWKSPQDHYKEEDSRKGAKGGFVHVVIG